ncbi:hypothetical protein J3459_016102 [Metarhizium acridum]|uniref:uncharacterized protein n=1 Tax=Metarhizium acridum TaxID=92637 RepID=UPI001C6B65EB|nr:hypothetical protein J3459_016102 [Metarhizium acridum]KAG8421927.1 hypothetical protein J3458_003758 [Metarhizium acridum]
MPHRRIAKQPYASIKLNTGSYPLQASALSVSIHFCPCSFVKLSLHPPAQSPEARQSPANLRLPASLAPPAWFPSGSGRTQNSQVLCAIGIGHLENWLENLAPRRRTVTARTSRVNLPPSTASTRSLQT